MIAAFAAALMLAVGVPGVANAANLLIGSPVTFVEGGSPYNPGNSGVFFPSTTLNEINTTDICAADALSMYQVPSSTQDFELTSYTKAYWGTYANFSLDVGATYKIYALENPSADYSQIDCENPIFQAGYPDADLDYAYTFSEFKLDVDGQEVWAAFVWFNLIAIQVSPAPAADPLTTTTPTLKRNGISFTPDNFDPTCAYEISTTAGTAIQNPVTGEVNVYGVGSGSSVSVTITDCTGATTTVSGTATAATAPVITLSKPTVSTTADAITCSAGTSTVNPTSIAYTLLVDGVAVSTRFSDGAIAPSLVATTAAQNLYSGATLSKASWSIDPAWAGKSYSCTTTSYADGAVGIANS